MTVETWFEDQPVLGKLPPTQAAAKLREVGEETAAAAIERAARGGTPSSSTFAYHRGWLGIRRAFIHTSHTFGYIASGYSSARTLPIQQVGSISPDLSLKNSTIKITLSGLSAVDYPGSGTHQILLAFSAQNQVQGAIENVTFNNTYRVREGERAAILNYPIFIGLNVGNNGIDLKFRTVNVKNEEDEAALGFLESDAFKMGLKLASTAQPAIVHLSEMAVGLTKMIAGRSKNVPVQDFTIGLDFSNNPMGAHLAEGVYIAVQIPETITRVWDWNDWVYDISTGHVVKDVDRNQLIDYNYIAFGISRYV